MLKRQRNEDELMPIMVDIEGLMKITALGRGTAIKLGEDANAVIRIGRRKMYYVDRIDEYLKSKIGQEVS